MLVLLLGVYIGPLVKQSVHQCGADLRGGQTENRTKRLQCLAVIAIMPACRASGEYHSRPFHFRGRDLSRLSRRAAIKK